MRSSFRRPPIRCRPPTTGDAGPPATHPHYDAPQPRPVQVFSALPHLDVVPAAPALRRSKWGSNSKLATVPQTLSHSQQRAHRQLRPLAFSMHHYHPPLPSQPRTGWLSRSGDLRQGPSQHCVERHQQEAQFSRFARHASQSRVGTHARPVPDQSRQDDAQSRRHPTLDLHHTAPHGKNPQDRTAEEATLPESDP